MTRFARAKGSKSSNERLPHEATPWHVMKQQLELVSEKDCQNRQQTKTAKQLLNEKDEPYYHQSLGNTKNDWAEFETKKASKIKNNKKRKDQECHKKIIEESNKLKSDVATKSSKSVKALKEKSSQQELLNVDSQDLETFSIPKSKKSSCPDKMKNKQQKLKAQDSSEHVSSEISSIDKSTAALQIQTNDKMNNCNHVNTVSVDSKGLETPPVPASKKSSYPDKIKNKQKKRKAQESLEHVSSEITSIDQSTASLQIQANDKMNNGNDINNKLSKRQKRNQKKQNQKSEDPSIVQSTASTFNTKGNDWNNSVHFERKRKYNDIEDKDSTNENPLPKFKRKFQNLEEKNYFRFGKNVPKKFQKKSAKIRDTDDHSRRKTDMGSVKMNINGIDVEIVKYDGFPIRKEDAERLIELRKQMVLKGIPKHEIDAAMKLERRKCEKALARIRRQVCFHCRKAGHNLSECPELGKEEAGTGICFKCGSTEHTHFECKVNKGDDYRYAKCFICREQGHLAKQCPDNPKGMYPDGGSCKVCGEVTHLKKDCPDLVNKKEETTLTLDTIQDDNLEALETKGSNNNKKESKSSKKIVKF